MARRLIDGETRTIKPEYHNASDLSFKVVAERYDSDTPLIHLHFMDYDYSARPIKRTVKQSYVLTDTDAHELAYMLRKALDILPSSK